MMAGDDGAGGSKTRYKQIAVAAVLLVGTTVVFVIIGATGPKSSQGTYHAMHTCIVPSASRHIWSPTTGFVDSENCGHIGRELIRVEEDQDKLKHYPLGNIIFYTRIPYLKGQVMSREFEFLLADLGMHFVFSKYLKEAVEAQDSMVKFEVALGYRDSVKGPWKRKFAGNVSRTLTCGYSGKSMFTCDHFSLFELGSCHHRQYIINLYFTRLPLYHKSEYQGLSQLDQLSLYEIHQSPSFTRQWLVLKTLFCPLSLLVGVWFLRRLVGVARAEKESPSLIAKFLAFLGMCLVFYNVPFQYLSLYYDCPWLLVLADFQQGLFIAALFGFWIVFVGEHSPDKDVKSHLGFYWKQMGVVFVASIFLFIYEFCERGIQVVFPFYSMWNDKFGVVIAWTFISVSALSALLYLGIFLVMLVRVMWDLRRKQKELMSLSPDARTKFNSLFSSLRFFLVVTTVVAVCSVLTVVLPSEILLHQWQHDKMDYNVYSGILTGNYGMWNSYCLVMMWIYAPSVSTATTHRGQGSTSNTLVDDPESLQKFISKKSQE